MGSGDPIDLAPGAGRRPGGATATRPAVLTARDVHMRFGGAKALNGVALEIRSGEVHALLGANGAGKTTVLRTLSGLLTPRGGRVLLDGDDLAAVRVEDRVRRGLVQVPEGRSVVTELTVEENLQLGAWHVARGRVPGALDAVYARFPILAERRGLPAGSLSGGEQQMLAIGRALVTGPRIVLLDEPSMGLAPKVVDEVFAVVREIRAAGTAVLLVEQNARRALEAADHGYVLARGEVVTSGPADRLLADPEVVAAYLGLDDRDV